MKALEKKLGGTMSDFKKFILKGNIIDMAVTGGASGREPGTFEGTEQFRISRQSVSGREKGYGMV